MTKRVALAGSRSRRRWSAYVLALLVTGATTLLRVGLADWFGDRPVLLLFVLPIFLSAYVGGLRPGLLATAVAALGSSYFLIPPLGSFAMGSSVDTWDWLILIVVGVLISTLTEARLRQLHRREASAAQGGDPLAQRKVQAGFALALVCLGVVGVISFTSVTRLNEEAELTRHSDEVIASLRLLLSSATDVETAQRGYAITGDERFLDPYRDARTRIDGQLAQLRTLTADNPEQRRRLDRLLPMMKERVDDAADNLELRRKLGFAAAQAAIASGRGKMLHDRLRKAVAEMEEMERFLLATRAWDARHAVTWARIVITGGSALAFGCVAVALFMIDGDFAGARRAQLALGEVNERLEARVRERTGALGRSEARLGGIVGSAMDAIISVNEAQRIVLFNAAAEKLFGCEASAALGDDLGRFIPLPVREQHRQRVQDFGHTGVTSRSMRSLSVLSALRADGVEFPIEASISQVEVAGERIYTVVLRDITERKRAAEASALLAALVESSSDAIVSKDLHSKVTSWNAGAERMFGYTAQEMIGSSITVLIPSQNQAEEEEILAQIRAGERVEHFETVRLHKDQGLVQVSVTVSPIKDPSGRTIGASNVARDISERKRVEARSEWLASFPERNPSPILEIEPASGTVQYANRAALRLFPELHDEGLSHPLVAELQTVTAQLAERGTLHRELWVGSACFSQLLTYSADPPRVRIYSTDISAGRNAEQALRMREAELHAADRRLAEIVHGMTEGCFALDPQWRFTFVNDRAVSLLRRERDQLLDLTIWDALPNLLGTPVEDHYRRSMTARIPVAFEVYSTNAERWLDVRLFPTGEGLAAFVLDIQARKLAELERQKFVSLAENSQEFIGMRSLQGDAVYVNRSALQMVGLDDLAQAALTTPADFFFPEDQAFIRDEFVPRVRRDGHAETEVRFRHFKTGEAIWMIYNAFVLRDSHGEPSGLATVSRNITERKHAEQQIKQLNLDLERRVVERTGQLEAANKELEAFSYSVSHDLRAPLRAVNGFAQILLEDYGPQLPTEAQEHLQTVCDGARRMGTLIDDLLSFARLSRLPLAKRAVDTRQLVRETLDELNAEQPGREVELHVAELPMCEADPALLKQVWVNLLSNAYKYTGQREHAVIEVGATEEQGITVYFVRDNGTGFDMQYAGKLFGVFQRLHRQDEFAGTGVGLAIVQRIVTRHGGRIWAEAAVNRGATFCFTLSGASA
jgi:PAS domain S-box-containing protein